MRIYTQLADLEPLTLYTTYAAYIICIYTQLADLEPPTLYTSPAAYIILYAC
jgi:hypothetical protein